MEKKVTLKILQKKPGVSTSTVSRVLNSSLPVNSETKNKIIKIIEETGYHPDFTARSLRLGKSNTIGIIIPDISNPFFSMLVKGADDYLKEKNFSTLICNSGNEKNDEKTLKFLIEKKTDAVIYAGIGNIKIFKNVGIPIVFTDRLEKDENFSYVVSNNYQGMTDMLEYLIKTKHKSYVFISGNNNIFSANERLRAFKDFTSTHNVISKIIHSDYSFDSGIDVVNNLSEFPDVIVCSNDLTAYGVIHGLKLRNLNVPKNLSVTGYDDLLFSEMLNPSLTTVNQPVYNMGKAAAEIILNMIEKNNTSVRIFKNELIVRNSTKNSGG